MNAINRFPRTPWRTLVLAAALLPAVTTTGCMRPTLWKDVIPPDVPRVANPAIVTVRGMVMLVGSEPGSAVVLASADSTRPVLALHGASLAMLRAVAGLDVEVTGRMPGARDMGAGPAGAPVLDAERFVVRAAGGMAAHDGVLVTREGGWYLARTDGGGEARIAMLPPALLAHAGARVFLVGSLEEPVTSFGIIAAGR